MALVRIAMALAALAAALAGVLGASAERLPPVTAPVPTCFHVGMVQAGVCP